jgi:hypothetical protein
MKDDRTQDPMAESIEQQIVREVSAWPDVTVGPHRFGGIEFRLGRRELGHLHGSRLADLPFPVRVRERLVAAGEAEPHHIYPESGWVSFYIHDASDVARVVGLFRLNYDRPWQGTKGSTTEITEANGGHGRI